ncbi:sulfite exporter TauE/SafE family protein [uncultured Massilia sp.]|uniref:sulfite exporter TauE/SafE family protein n=1 Tax=uncultured Massilia sp. TaxID=169973 RepID=UPI0025E858E3|nr:sulfite exporter TauE/SafE family protein [uncultured Massilia sp.]
MELGFDTVAPLALIVMLAYTVFGLTGFGSSITAMPLLVQLIPLKMAVPLMLVYDLASGLVLGLKNLKVVERREVLRLVPFMLAGMAAGTFVLAHAPERILLLVLGAFILCYAAYSLLRRGTPRPLGAIWSLPFGLVGGTFTAMFGTGGPFYTIYLARRLADKLVLRATISGTIFFSGLARLALFSSAGFYRDTTLLALVALLFPFALGGLWLGNRLHSRLPAARVVQAIWGVLILGGASLVLRNL